MLEFFRLGGKRKGKGRKERKGSVEGEKKKRKGKREKEPYSALSTAVAPRHHLTILERKGKGRGGRELLKKRRGGEGRKSTRLLIRHVTSAEGEKKKGKGR